MNATLCQAIEGKRVISFDYDGGPRTAEPHCLGVSREGHELLRVFQTGGFSESGNPVGWKLLRVDQINNLRITADVFPGPRPQYNPADKAMARVLCCL